MIVNDHPLKGIGPERVILAGSYAPNNVTDPVATSHRGREFGQTFTVARTGVGQHTITLPSGYTLPAQPASIQATPQCDSFTNWFEVLVVGETTLNTTTRQFVIQCHRNGVAQEVQPAAGARVNFMLHVSNNTGK